MFQCSRTEQVSEIFASVSKLVHVWREKAADIMAAWDANFKDADVEVQKLGRRYPLRVMGSRWGSIESAEDFLLVREKERVVPTLLEVLSKHMKGDTPGTGRTLQVACCILFFADRMQPFREPLVELIVWKM